MDEQRAMSRPEPGRSRREERELPKVGQTIRWRTLGGAEHRGRVVEMDSNVAHVLCDDGRRRCVEC